MSEKSSKLTFFRQSGWMVFATTAGGALMYAVHIAASRMDPRDAAEKPEYGVFVTLLQVLNQMAIPALGLQTIIMRQTVAAIAEEQQRQLSRAIRWLLAGSFGVWVVMLAATCLFQDRLLTSLKIGNPAALWLTAAWGLWMLWLPIFVGLLQGKQNFLWMGMVSILNGFIRLTAIAIAVFLLGWQAAGACFGVLVAVVTCVAISAWQTRTIWLGPGAPVVWEDWLGRVLPLTIGPGVIAFMMSQDMIVVQATFPKGATAYYGAAGMIGRALVFLTAPLTIVMFPKIVDAAARSRKSDAMLLALGATALLGAVAAVFCTVLPSVPLQLVYDQSYLKVKWLVPWFSWCMLPLTLGSVLVNNLLAREKYRAIPWLVLLAVGYWFVLRRVCAGYTGVTSETLVQEGFLRVVQTLGLFGSLLVAISLWFNVRANPEPKQGN